MAINLAALIADKRSKDELLTMIGALPFRAGIKSREWLAAVSSLRPVFASDFAWLPQRDGARVRGAAKDSIQRALTEFFPPHDSPQDDDLKSALDPFVTWLEAASDDTIVRFSWKLMAWRPRLGWKGGAWYPVWRMEHSGRLAGPIAEEKIEIAVTIVEEARAMGSWPEGRWRFIQWESASKTYFKSLEDPSYLVRAASGYALGALLWGCHSNGEDCGAPAGAEMLDFIQKQEQKRAGVAGPFFTGADLLLTYTFDEWLSKWSAPADFDMRGWFLETLRSSAKEVDVPDLISLEFFAHELFSCDAAGIEEILDMGREDLAVLAATQEPHCIERLLPLLTKMSQSVSPRVARAIEIYLKERTHHAGMSSFDDEDQ